MALNYFTVRFLNFLKKLRSRLFRTVQFSRSNRTSLPKGALLEYQLTTALSTVSGQSPKEKTKGSILAWKCEPAGIPDKVNSLQKPPW